MLLGSSFSWGHSQNFLRSLAGSSVLTPRPLVSILMMMKPAILLSLCLRGTTWALNVHITDSDLMTSGRSFSGPAPSSSQPLTFGIAWEIRGLTVVQVIIKARFSTPHNNSNIIIASAILIEFCNMKKYLIFIISLWRIWTWVHGAPHNKYSRNR